MKKTFIVANWKSNKISLEAKNWLGEISSLINQASNLSNKEIIVCPSFIHLCSMKTFIEEKKLPIKLGAQNISPFDEGAYTGEVSASLLKEFADYVIIGHSERRSNFNEDDEILFKKAELAKKYGLISIFCVQGIETTIPLNIAMIAYEPVNAIGTGNPDTPENAEQVAKYIKENSKAQFVLYGGSVTSGNVSKFTQMPSIDGVLVGGASLDAQEFYKIIQNA